MTEERIVRADTPEGHTHTSTTIITDRPDPDSGISVWFVMFAVLLAVLIGIWAFVSMGNTETAETDVLDSAGAELSAAADAVGDAAADVGDAAGDVGAAAGDVRDAAADTANDVADDAAATMESVEPAPAE